jgi:hypothetical protein
MNLRNDNEESLNTIHNADNDMRSGNKVEKVQMQMQMWAQLSGRGINRNV